MTNFTAKILNNAVSGIKVHQALIATTGNNINNVSTPGYSRRVVEVTNRGVAGNSAGANVGNGVDIGAVTQVVDRFKDKVVRDTLSEKSSAEIKADYLDRIQRLFPLDGEGSSIGSAMGKFFSSISDLSFDPSSIERRNAVVYAAEDLVSTISTTYNTLADLQDEIDNRLGIELDTVNTITAELASLNGTISAGQLTGQNALDALDQRTRLLEDLSQKISFSVTTLEDGSINVSLPNGFNLVNGSNSRALSITESPSFAPGALAPGLNGGILGYIVYDYSNGAGTQELNLTDVIAGGQGSIGGLLAIRGVPDVTDTTSFEAIGTLPEIASRIESITRQLLTTFNQTYLGPVDEDSSTPSFYDPSAGDLDSQPVTSPYGFFTFTGATDDNSNGLPDDLAALGIDSFSGLIELVSTDPRDIAAAVDKDGANNSTTFAPGDGDNLTALLALRDQVMTFSSGNYSESATFDQAYNNAVSYIGNETYKGETAQISSEAKYRTALASRDSTSAVSLDEAFVDLLKHQKGFEASARLLRVAQELLEQILGFI